MSEDTSKGKLKAARDRFTGLTVRQRVGLVAGVVAGVAGTAVAAVLGTKRLRRR